jgi:malate synthase
VQPAVGVRIGGPLRTGYGAILTPEALEFVADLTCTFRERVVELLERRAEAQALYDAGGRPGFLEATRGIREAEWTVTPAPHALQDHRVEITGPADGETIHGALISGASAFTADLEDSTSPTWDNLIRGQLSLRDLASGRMTRRDAGRAGRQRPDEETLTVILRPRGWHLWERHLEVDGRPVPAALFDFGLFFYHNARALVARGTGPYICLPKLQGHLEARLWNEVFLRAQRAAGLSTGTIKATVLIETLPAVFEMDEILYELREHAAGLRFGWKDYVFSFVKTRRNHAEAVLPEPSQISLDQAFLRACVQRMIETCRRRNAQTMAASLMPVHSGMEDGDSEEQLFEPPAGTPTEEGLEANIQVGVRYLEAWLRGNGSVPLGRARVDGATAEICRSEVWQWVRHGVRLADGQRVTVELFRRALANVMGSIRATLGEERVRSGRFREACELFDHLSTADDLADFLTVPAYELLLSLEVANPG